MSKNEQGKEPNVLDTHSQSVGTKAAGYMWLTRISKTHIKLQEYNGMINHLAKGSSVSYDLQARVIKINDVRAQKVRDGADKDALAQIDDALGRLKAELVIMDRLQATSHDARVCLGEKAEEILEALKIKDLSHRHAFKTATSKLEKKSEKENVNYLIRALDTEGDRQERLLKRETKDKENRILVDEIVARFIYTEHKDADGVAQGEISSHIEDIGLDDPVVLEACSEIEDRFNREIEGASGTRFRTSIGHLTSALQGIPLAPRGWVYYCVASKAPVVSLTRELVRWVDFKFREGSDSSQFLAVPLLGGEEMEETVVSAANQHLQAKLSAAIAKIQEIREARGVLGDGEDDETLAQVEALNSEEAELRQEVAEVQANVKVCLNEMQTAQGVLHQASRVLLLEYRQLLGI